jgi:amino acid transporter
METTGSPGSQAAPDSAPAGEHQLRRHVLSPWGVLAQSVAQIAPSAAAATSVALIASIAGNGAWLTWAICAVADLLIAYGIVRLSRRFATSGGLYSLSARSWGSIGGVLAGGGLAFINGLAGGPALTTGFAIYFSAFLQELGLPASPWIFSLLLLVNLVVAAWFAYNDIRVSAHILLVVEGLTILAILVLLGIVLVHHGTVIDPSQLRLTGASPHAIFLGLVLAVYSFGGFESATALGQEARNPRRTIPLAVVASIVIVGLFFMVNAYIQPLGFIGSKLSLVTSQAPLDDLAKLAGAPFFQVVVTLGVSASMFSCTLAIFNSTCRMWFTLAREGLLPKALARSHPRHQSPYVAVVVMAILWALILLGTRFATAQPLDIYGYLGTMSGFGFILAYFAVTIGALVYFSRTRSIGPFGYAVGVVAILVLIGAFVTSVYPVPAFPYSLINIIFIVIVLLLIAGWLVNRARGGTWLSKMGSSVETDTALAAEAADGDQGS